MKTIIDGSRIMTLGVLVSISPLPPWVMIAVLTAGMIYNFRGSIYSAQGGASAAAGGSPPHGSEA
jgi:hypothetical protein